MFVYIDGYGFYQLLTFLDAFSRLPIHHELLAQASSEVAAAVLKKAVEKNGRIPRQMHYLDLRLLSLYDGVHRSKSYFSRWASLS